ncbi:MAG: hypothetical protein JNM39_15660 [Bdellovibrionaceae bacterium]|nr:hypothetical protein [Pseudobdellovibrionaceae bacterium]
MSLLSSDLTNLIVNSELNSVVKSKPVSTLGPPILDVKELELPEALFAHPVSSISLLEGVALFELIGVSWMMALTYQNWSHETHEHAYDEVRHTKLIQDCAKKCRWALSDEQIILETKLTKIFYIETEKYLQNLSRRVFKLTYHQKTCDSKFAISSYALLAFLIERRIMKIYPAMVKHSQNTTIQTVARSIIHDERQHLTLVTGKLPSGLDFADSSQDEIILMEKKLANEWMRSLIHGFSEILKEA